MSTKSEMTRIELQKIAEDLYPTIHDAMTSRGIAPTLSHGIIITVCVLATSIPHACETASAEESLDITKEVISEVNKLIENIVTKYSKDRN